MKEKPTEALSGNQQAARGWRYHARKPLSFLGILPACMVYAVLFLDWILYMHDDLMITFLLMMSPFVVLPICAIAILYQIIKKNTKNVVFLLSPFIYIAALSLSPRLDYADTIFRFQTELFIQKHFYIPEIADISNGKEPSVTYKEWKLPYGLPNQPYWIVYDATGETIAKKDGLKIPDGPYIDECRVYHIQDHFYMLTIHYPGKIWY